MTETGTSRWLSVDLARGAAVLAMVVYHTAWDLSALGLVEAEITTQAGWSLFARAIAASFLALAGIGLVLAHGDGIRPAAFGRRLAVVAGAALLISLATFFAFPDSWIFFGILHNIAVSSVLALAVLRLPAPVAALLGLAAIGLPVWLAGRTGGPDLLDEPALFWLGLGRVLPRTNDYVPLFPWTGFVFLGVSAGRVLRARAGSGPASRPGPAARRLAWIGRRSLPIYLLHQPILYGFLFGVSALLGPRASVEDARYLGRCETACLGQGQTQARCTAFCACNLRGLSDEGLRDGVMRKRVTPEEVDRLQALSRACARAHP